VNRNECSGGEEWIGDFTALCMQVGHVVGTGWCNGRIPGMRNGGDGCSMDKNFTGRRLRGMSSFADNGPHQF
jgi:hypothetical protein